MPHFEWRQTKQSRVVHRVIAGPRGARDSVGKIDGEYSVAFDVMTVHKVTLLVVTGHLDGLVQNMHVVCDETRELGDTNTHARAKSSNAIRRPCDGVHSTKKWWELLCHNSAAPSAPASVHCPTSIRARSAGSVAAREAVIALFAALDLDLPPRFRHRRGFHDCLDLTGTPPMTYNGRVIIA